MASRSLGECYVCGGKAVVRCNECGNKYCKRHKEHHRHFMKKVGDTVLGIAALGVVTKAVKGASR